MSRVTIDMFDDFPNPEQARAMNRALTRWTVEEQRAKTIEKLSRCAAVLARNSLRQADQEDVRQELADALIMLTQMIAIYGYHEVMQDVNYNLERLALRVV